MATRIGINGFGRIGRLSLRAMLKRYPGQFDVVAVAGREVGAGLRSREVALPRSSNALSALIRMPST